MMKITILKDGRYNDYTLKSFDFKAGDVVRVRPPYGMSLIADGYAEEYVENRVTAAISAPEETKSVVQYDFARIKGVSGEISDALHAIDVNTLDDLKAKIDSGDVLNIPGVGLKKLASIKKQLGM